MGLTKKQKDEAMELKRLNRTELVQLLTEIGFRAHRGMKKIDLIEALVTDTEPVGGNPFDEEREIIEAFLKKNWDRVSSQLGLRCHGNCHKHNDMQVLACWLNSHRALSVGD